jgi:aspartyl aminopeptidase
VYTINRNKSIAVAVLGKRPIEDGLNIIASHIDVPRLDLKQNPLYEDDDTKLALFKTHYYGGIKKYQWVNIPLALHGKVVKGDGSEVDINIGESPDDPVFTITDLLPHLARKKQAKRALAEGIKGEELNILVGSRPVSDKHAKKKVKLWILDYLNKNYGMVEEDFVSAELEIVPAGRARDIGFDRSLVGAYGHDDRICAYTSLRALTDIKTPSRTGLALMFDKEEIGSEGSTGVKSRFLVNTIGDLIGLRNPGYPESMLRKALENSRALSSDVNAGINPNYKGVHETRNAARLGHGVVITKFTGSGGKYASNDASAEFMGAIRRLLNENKIIWQTAELGKVDEGGGGTVARFLAEHNMDVIDCGPPILSMHSPFEISSKIDIYSTYEAYRAFFEWGG